jgi:diaminohydroxyphosphoribosylaminopyrimidine deaminase/5-amino-6-(5-phosphoribosylamino)uracil reductase
MTLDGKIASHTGQSKWITGEVARRKVHRLRAQSGAVMVGVKTLLADDARLDARLAGVSLPRQPLRIVVDSRLSTPSAAAAVRLARQSPAETPLLIATTEAAGTERAIALDGEGVEVLRLPATSVGRVDLCALMRALAERKVISVLVEGGGELHAALLAAGLAQRALFFVAPKLLGGREAPTPVEGVGADSPADAIPLAGLQARRYGRDIALEGRIVALEGGSERL